MTQQDKTLLSQALKNKTLVVVYRDDISAAYYSGIPVILSNELVVLAKENDFRLDGYVAVALRDVTMVEQYDDAPFLRKAMEGEGIYNSLKKPAAARADNWKTLVGELKKTGSSWLSVECESSEDTLFYIGTVDKIDENCMFMKRIDADGSWHEASDPVPYEDITLIGFGDNYLRVYEKYSK